MTESQHASTAFDHALDSALERALKPPQVPETFRRELNAALARAHDTDLSALRARLERERHERLAQLEASYVRVKRRTLGTMIGAAFACGAAVAVALPWLQSRFGSVAPLVLAFAGAVVGLAIGMGFFGSRRAPPFGR